MANFFIHRPIFAWVVALFLMVLGVVSITQLPISQYPKVAPPAIVLNVAYPGASAQTLEDSVLSVIEREMNGASGLMYMEAVAQADGTGQLTLTFENGTNEDLAQVDVQNRLSRATPRLPSSVTQQGVQVSKSRSNFLLFTILSSDNPAIDNFELADYASRNVVPELQRVKGVGNAQLFAAERAMRIWLDPARLQSFNLSSSDVNAAIQAQNVQISSGSIGDLPNLSGQTITASVTAQGQLSTPERFGEIVLRTNRDGSAVRLKDVARIELGSQSYANSSRIDGKSAVGVGVQLSNDGNALATATAIKKRLDELQAFFPEGVKATIPYDTSGFVEISIRQVVMTLLEAILLVFLVMYLFLQNIRYTIIPTIVVPVALLATFGVLLALGMSINVLTMFGMVLVIGIVVDDAIIVVENVERIMSEEGLSPKDATIKAMGQISGAVIGVTVVLISVFVPLAFFGGAVGNIYRQFSAVMATSIGFSAFMALSLTPALCASFLKPVEAGHHHAKTGFFGWFNRGFAASAKRYEGSMARMIRRAIWWMALYAAICAATALFFMRLPSSFLPNEDQGFVISNVQLPPGATQERTRAVIEEVEKFMLAQPEVEHTIGVLGFSFSGRGQNAALVFTSLKNWDKRKGAGQSAEALAGRAMQALTGRVRDAFVYTLSPPPIAELGNATGVIFRLQDRGNKGHAALLAARNQLLGMAMQSPVLTGVRPDGIEDAPQLAIDIDRDKANALGVPFSAISSTLSTMLGSSYINDFPNNGRLQRVIVQGEARDRMQPEDVLKLNVSNSAGSTVPLSSFATVRWEVGPMQTVRYNGYPTMRIEAAPKPGYSTGQAMEEMEKLAAQLPEGFSYEWTGTSFEEKRSGSQAYALYAFSLLAIFLCLAALYESWSIPFAVLLVVPLGLLGVILAAMGGGQLNDVYFKLGMITIIGLSAKNAILIIEFAREQHAKGKSVVASALDAAHLRFRPILMTSMAFTLGVLPLALATGASSASQRAIGIGVTGGMISATILGLMFVPMFYVVVMSLFNRKRRAAASSRVQVKGE